MTDDVVRTLDAQRRRLVDIEAEIVALRTSAAPGPGVVVSSGAMTFSDVVRANDERRAARDWSGYLPPEPPGEGGRAWAAEDIAVAGLAGALGFAAAWLDAPIECRVRDRLRGLSDTPLLRRWEAEAKLWAIDYSGPGYGGPNHRVRGSGHDLLRAAAALRQIRSGAFEGVRWVDGARVRERIAAAAPVESLPEALLLWCKHLATDVVTDRSLPLPGWTWLNELPWEQAQQFARRVYMGERGGTPGLTLRTGVLASLPLLTVETLVRAHMHGRALHERGTVVLTGPERVLRDELLLVAHGLTGAASLGRTLAVALSGSGPLALCHVNAPVLLRLGRLGWEVAGARTERVPEWVALLERLDAPWTLELAADIDAHTQ